MSSIPLPALAVKPPQQQDTIGQFANLLALKNQIQNAPLQRQALQQQIQSGQLQLQQQQLAVQNQKAMTQAFQQWDGKNYGDLAHLALQAGASGDAVMALQQHALAVRDTASQIAQRDAQTGQANLDTLIKRNGLIAGKIAAVSQLPDDQLAQGVSSAMQELQGQLDPQHLQQGQALLQGLQSGQLPADRARQALDMFRKSFLSDGQIMEDVKNQAQTREANSRANEADVNAQKAQTEMQLGTGPMADSRYRNILMAEKLGRPVTPEDQAFKAAYEKQKMLVPTATINLQSGLLNDQAKQMAAQTYAQTGQLPAGMRSPAMSAQILNTAAQNGAPNIAANKAEYAANAESLKKMQANFDNVTAFENTAGKNLDQFLATAKSVVDSGSPLINSPLRSITNTMAGSDKMAAFNAARQTAIAEISKVLSSANAGSGVVSDSARHEVEGLIGPNASLKQIYSAAQILRKDMENRHQAYQQQLNDIKGRMSGGAKAAPSNTSSDDPFAQFGGALHK